MSLGFDIIFLIMPVTVIRSLQLPFARKVAAIGIFWLGAFCVVSATARLYLLYQAIHSVTENPNAYANLSIAFVFAEMEPNASVIAASLPMLRPLFTRDNKSVGSWFLSWSSRLSRRPKSKGSRGVSTPFRHPGGSSQVYAKASSATGSTRELNPEIPDIHVMYDIELGHYNTTETK